MLDSLESFLSTFQNDLSSVSGHISELQNRSRTIESRLQSRKVASNLISSAYLTSQLETGIHPRSSCQFLSITARPDHFDSRYDPR